jgi:hypothetical protein
MANGQSTLQSVYSYSFTTQNLFQVALVKDTDPALPDYKRKFFCFLTLAPGEKTQTGRTYNFSNRINMKQDVHNVLSLAHAIRAVARGQKALIGNFSLFTDSSKSSYGQGGVKQVFVNEYIKKPQGQPQQGQQPPPGERLVSIGFRSGQTQPVGLTFSVPDAMSCADILEFIAKMGLKMDANSSIQGVAKAPAPAYQEGSAQSRGNQQQNRGNQPPPSGPPQMSTPDQAADNFASGMEHAAGFTGNNQNSPPSMPPSMGDDDIPF